MKRFPLIFVMLFSLNVFAQNSNPLIYSEVVDLPGLSKDEIYSMARMWFVEAYKNPQKVLQIQDKESGEIVGKGNTKYYSKIWMGAEGSKGVINYTVKIFIKDGKYKYEITDFIHKGITYDYGLITDSKEYDGSYKLYKSHGNKVWTELKSICEDEKDFIIASLKSSMLKTNKVTNSDW